jgi:flagellar basal body rod protein FlgG
VNDNDTAVNVDKPTVLGGYLQQSNVNTPEEMVCMLENNRLAESLSKAMQMLDETLGRANQDLAGQ